MDKVYLTGQGISSHGGGIMPPVDGLVLPTLLITLAILGQVEG
jgi:hypothetical protein